MPIRCYASFWEYGIGHPGICKLGGYWGVGGLLKRVKNRSLMTCPDAQHSS